MIINKDNEESGDNLVNSRDRRECYMDIGSLSMAMSQSSLNTAVQLSVLKLGMNSSEELMNNMQEMMEDVVVDPNVGQNLDITV
ncbi:Hypothetical protein CM240_0883 [Clostridium bornimense]|uniref:Motility protein n=2 Tax=Clostridium bornimense TaxID=1216932 RepID=W6S183_9CLOT|nr:Hypothetical protein CM240_0883 [Clostridium bornimense]